MSAWRSADATTVREQIARACLSQGSTTDRLGTIMLREHQRDAAARLRDSIRNIGGGLLADDVGLGKTYTALAAAGDARPLLIVAPAALATMWRTALDAARVPADFVSFESLSRRCPDVPQPALVIVDEAHHARNPHTKRYARLAELTRVAPVLLLSATPVHNATADLHALLALFLGTRAERLTRPQLSACIVRRTSDDVGDRSLPHRAPPVWLEVPGAPEVLRAITEIPSPCPPRDGGDGGALITLTLVRAWASTDAALRNALRRRIARAGALADALATGRHPTRSELLAWVVGDDATQLAFPELMASTQIGDWQTLGDAVARHISGVRRALGVVAECADPVDDRRCALIREIRERHPNERIVVFSQFADSVRAMFDRLRGDGRVAAVTASGAEVAGGPVTRADVLGRFAPRSTGSIGVSRPKAAEEVSLLIATDMLSEGLNLQDASVVVHLDLPWTAARLTQRLGRVWRLGSAHARVHEYALAPPAPAEQMLHVTRILMAKAGAASRVVGDAIAPLIAQRAAIRCASVTPSLIDPNTANESLRRLVRTWTSDAHQPTVASDDEPHTSSRRPAVAAVRAAFDGWIAVVTAGGTAQLIAGRLAGSATADPTAILDLARAAEGRACIPAPARVARVMRQLEAYVLSQRAAHDAGVALSGSRAHSTASSRIAALAAAAPPHRRVAVSRLAATARHAVAASRTAGAERLLSALLADGSAGVATDDGGETWLSRVIGIADASRPNAAPQTRESAPFAVDAVLLLIR